MATGTAANLTEVSIVDARVAGKLIDVDFTGVQGDSTTTVRVVGSDADGVEMPKGVTAMNLMVRSTNAPGGAAGDITYGVIEILIGTEWYQLIATAGVPGTATAADSAVVNAFATQNAASVVPTATMVPFDAPALAGILGATNNVSNFGWQLASRVRIAINATHPGLPAGSANLHAELWTIPYRGTTR